MKQQIAVFNQVRVPPKSFKDLKGAVNQKRFKNTELGYRILEKAFFE
jgi:hypothetical protein